VRAGRPPNRRRVRLTEGSSSLTSCQPRPRRSAVDPIDGSRWHQHETFPNRPHRWRRVRADPGHSGHHVLPRVPAPSGRTRRHRGALLRGHAPDGDQPPLYLPRRHGRRRPATQLSAPLSVTQRTATGRPRPELRRPRRPLRPATHSPDQPRTRRDTRIPRYLAPPRARARRAIPEVVAHLCDGHRPEPMHTDPTSSRCDHEVMRTALCDRSKSGRRRGAGLATAILAAGLIVGRGLGPRCWRAASVTSALPKRRTGASRRGSGPGTHRSRHRRAWRRLPPVDNCLGHQPI
jgi:hypothetical protein